jgi:uncharacterized protein
MSLNEVVKNAIATRSQWLAKLLDPRRDIENECGHPPTLAIEDFRTAFLRGDLASRVVSIWPDESWQSEPDVFETEDETETEFEREWKVVQKQHSLFARLHRADTLSGIGRFGVLLLGLDDGKPLHEPAEGIGHKLLYVRPFDEHLAKVQTLENDVTSPRYGLPTLYEIHFSDIVLGAASDAQARSNTTSKRVHWSRVIHLADNRMASDVFGTPRMEVVFNRLLDLKKIMGGSGEMFWKGGFPGLSIETHPGMENAEFDSTATKQQMDDYMNKLQRYIATVGMSVKSLNIQIADPRPHVDVQVRLIAMTMGVPWRLLMGSEAAQLASEQDAATWNKRVNRRRQEYLTPFVLSPLIDQLIALGVLPTPKEYQIHWDDLNSPSDNQKAEVAEKQTNALSKYVQGGVDALVPPFHYLTLFLGMDDAEAKAIIQEAGVEDGLDHEDDEDDASQTPNTKREESTSR